MPTDSKHAYTVKGFSHGILATKITNDECRAPENITAVKGAPQGVKISEK